MKQVDLKIAERLAKCAVCIVMVPVLWLVVAIQLIIACLLPLVALVVPDCIKLGGK